MLSREQELEPNTSYNYRWWLGLIFPHIGKVQARRLSARMVKRVYRAPDADGGMTPSQPIQPAGTAVESH